MKTLSKLFNILYSHYGAQGWWPLLNAGGYHKHDYTFPKNNNEVFEICIGAILTQNTTFTSVVKSLKNLNGLNALSVDGIKKLPLEELQLAIKPSGYFNQKTRYILEFISFFESLHSEIPTREALLSVVGIGEETADSILLYAYKQDQFVVDTYTKRIFLHLGFIGEKTKYKDLKYLVENSFENDGKNKEELVVIYQELHALLVEHAKRFYSKKPYGDGCFLRESLTLESL